MDINLLPIELSPARTAVKFAKRIKKAIIVAVGFFLILTVSGIIFIVFLGSQVNASVAKQKSLKQNIGALEATEQKIFIIKDRISKIKFALSAKNAADSFQTVDQVLSTLPPSVIVNSVEINTTKTAFSVLSKNSLSMASFLNSLVTNGIYKNISLTGFIFTPDRGYVISLESNE